jgi:hypothetical protein
MASRRQEPAAGEEQCAGTGPECWNSLYTKYYPARLAFLLSMRSLKRKKTIQLECNGDFLTLHAQLQIHPL